MITKHKGPCLHFKPSSKILVQSIHMITQEWAPQLGAGSLPAVVRPQRPPCGGRRRIRDGRLTAVRLPAGPPPRSSQTADARGPQPPARDLAGTLTFAPAAAAPSQTLLFLGQPSPRPCGGARARLAPLDRRESQRHGIWGIRKGLKYAFGSWKSEVKAGRDQMKSFNDRFRPRAKGS